MPLRSRSRYARLSAGTHLARAFTPTVAQTRSVATEAPRKLAMRPRPRRSSTRADDKSQARPKELDRRREKERTGHAGRRPADVGRVRRGRRASRGWRRVAEDEERRPASDPVSQHARAEAAYGPVHAPDRAISSVIA